MFYYLLSRSYNNPSGRSIEGVRNVRATGRCQIPHNAVFNDLTFAGHCFALDERVFRKICLTTDRG